MSTTTSKLYHYAYPFLPPVALAGGIVVAWLAAMLYRALAGPAAALDRSRRRVFGRLLDVTAWQVTATMAAFGALLLAALTYAFERLSVSAGPVDAEELVACPGPPLRPRRSCWQARRPRAFARHWSRACCSSLCRCRRTTATWHSRKSHRSPYRDVRDCLRPIVAREVARGKPAPGVWVEPAALSHRPFFYLRGLGPWQRRDHPSNQTVAMHLVVPQHYRPVLLSPERYSDVIGWITNDRAAAARTRIGPVRSGHCRRSRRAWIRPSLASRRSTIRFWCCLVRTRLAASSG